MNTWPSDTTLVPAIVQDPDTGTVLMLAWMNAEAYQRTQETGQVTFWSRSREALWTKGETSGNVLQFVSAAWDCDSDSLLVLARPTGPTCHTGAVTCFGDHPLGPGLGRLDDLWSAIADRVRTRPSGSYTANLVALGPDGPGRKVAEEAVEVVIAAKDHAAGEADDRRVAEEVADLLYHALVVLAERQIDPSLVMQVLEQRRRPGG
ncbi:MAG: bifunctional phosphoribosyl-AMP cyclohydrolase/phosphoribosyl-ATP diphosphatase HisIE [Acidimicrobiia bacterium]|nr:bifunctional phosphoribosyl-AMP cyclohydrolase/phosphoribosyl-ATP diphosphatase HisIE [Acidimicrobiia bacterium]